MAKELKAKLILELLERGMSCREIARTRHISFQTIKKVRDMAREKDISYGDIKDMTDHEVKLLLFPEVEAAEAAYAKIDYDYVHKEMQRAGVTLKLLHEEYYYQASEDGLIPKSYTSFCRGYSAYTVARNVTNHLEHKPGQAMQVDWDGTVMKLFNDVTGEVTKAYLFVAVLPYSNYAYVEATLDMKQKTWLLCHVHAYEFFGGVAVRTVCDNLKTGVVKHPKEGEIVLNEAYEALGRHYVTAIMPTGVRKPKQKANVEGTCGDVATAIVARLRNEHFATLKQLNDAILEKLDAFNEAPFQKREGSRKAVFEEVEAAFLAPLPSVPFEVCEWVYARNVNINFHVIYLKNQYSVPHTLVGKKVDLKVTDSMVEIYDGGIRIASHKRFPSYVMYRYSTDPSHMPPEFCKPAWDDVRILNWARNIGPSTHAVVARIFSDVQIKEQAYNPALAVLNLTKRYTEQDLEQACEYALTKTPRPRCKFLKSVLASKVANNKVKETSEEAEGGYIRGMNYYKKEN